MAHPNPPKILHMVKKGPWSQIEDEMLIRLVSMYGPEQWMEISKDHGSRNAKQCRERYHQNLKPTINRGPISAEEGVAIERLYVEKGPKWAEISRALGGRSDNQVKNWYNGQKNRRTKLHTHSSQQVPLLGSHHSISAVKPVDIHILQQRGHTNPYFQGNSGHYQQSRSSPTTSQISDAPSLISDASSISPGISPSSIVVYPAPANPWSLPEGPNRSILPSLNQLTPLIPLDPAVTGFAPRLALSQNTQPMTWEQREPTKDQGTEMLTSRPGDEYHKVEDQSTHPQTQSVMNTKPGQLPPLQSLLSGSTRTPHMSLAEPSSPGKVCHTLPKLYLGRGAGRGQQPSRSGPQPSPMRTSRPSVRHEPYPSSRSQDTAVPAPDATTKCRMSLANVLV